MRNNQPVTPNGYALASDQTLISITDLKGRITYCNPSFATVSGSRSSPSLTSTWIARSAPIAIAVRSTSCALGGPALMTQMSSTPPGADFFSRMRTDSSTESSSNGFMLCLTPAVSTPVWALLTRGLTWERRAAGLVLVTGA